MLHAVRRRCRHRCGVALLFLTGWLNGGACRHPDAPKPDLEAYLMAGQSNMAGRGVVEGVDAGVDPRILMLDGGGRFVPKTQPNRLWQGALAGLDCGTSFATALLEHRPAGDRIGLVPCAVGNTRIQEWLGDSLHTVRLYSQLVARARTAEEQGAALRGLLWHQGESNALDVEGAAGYGDCLQAFIRRLRTDLGRPDLPVYIGLLPAWNGKAGCRRLVNAQILATARALPAVYPFPTDDLAPKSDSVHYNAAGQRGLGQRYAAAVLAH